MDVRPQVARRLERAANLKLTSCLQGGEEQKAWWGPVGQKLLVSKTDHDMANWLGCESSAQQSGAPANAVSLVKLMLQVKLCYILSTTINHSLIP